MHLLDTTMFHAREGGGVGRYLRAKRAWLARHTAVRHTLLVPGARDADLGGGELRRAAPPLPFSGGYRFPLGRAAWSQRIVAAQPDLVECADPYVPAWASLDAAETLGIPAVAFCHSDLVRLAAMHAGAAAARAARAYLRGLYDRFDCVIAPSRHMATRLEHFGVRHVVTRPLGVDAHRFHPSRARRALVRRRLGLDADARLLVFAGRFAREKNLPLLLQAVHRLDRRHHLLLVGAGARVRSGSRVTTCGYVADDTTLATLLASADAFVHAGDQETFGLAALEAMACGVPVACVPGGAVSELVAPEWGVVAARRSAPALAEAIDALLGGDPRAAGARARAQVVRTHAWDAVMPDLMATYGTVAKRTVGLVPPLYAAR